HIQWTDLVSYRSSYSRLRSRDDPSSNSGKDQSSGCGDEIDLAHVNSPVHRVRLSQVTIRPFRIIPMSLAIGLVSFVSRCIAKASTTLDEPLSASVDKGDDGRPREATVKAEARDVGRKFSVSRLGKRRML